MLLLRSIVFNLAFYLNLTWWCLLVMPASLISGRAVLGVARAWSRTSRTLMRVIVGTHYELRGTEHIPPGGCLVAAKHQSFWETFTLLCVFDRPTYILKRELTWIPAFGWALLRSGMIPIDRSAGGRAIVGLNREVAARVSAGRQVIIFPEGTRRPPGAPPAYRQGVAHLYARLDVPCLPVALNSGLFWPRRQFRRRPGTVVVEILPPIPPGLDRATFMATLQDRIETASDRLLSDAGGTSSAAGYRGPDGI